jgi:Icc protein
MTLRVIQISDTHLSGRKPLFQANFDTMRAWLHADPPDLIICSGDLSLDGADREEDLRFAAEQLARLPARCLVIPGNHDVGDFAELETSQVTSAERLARWHAVLGPDHFVQDVPGWRLIGLNTQSLGSGLAEEAAQAEALTGAVAGADGRALALFLHKPLCQHRLDETDLNYWSVLQPARDALLGAFGSTTPRFVASGHIHQWRDHAPSGLRQIWAPAISFIVGEEQQPSLGSKLLGAVEHLLHPDGTHASRLLTLDGLALHDITKMPGLYSLPEAEG